MGGGGGGGGENGLGSSVLDRKKRTTVVRVVCGRETPNIQPTCRHASTSTLNLKLDIPNIVPL